MGQALLTSFDDEDLKTLREMIAESSPDPASRITAGDVGRLLSVDRSTVNRWAREGRIYAERIGDRGWRFDPARLDVLPSLERESSRKPPPGPELFRERSEILARRGKRKNRPISTADALRAVQ
jgi:excisionase family DNA binding protein